MKAFIFAIATLIIGCRQLEQKRRVGTRILPLSESHLIRIPLSYSVDSMFNGQELHLFNPSDSVQIQIIIGSTANDYSELIEDYESNRILSIDTTRDWHTMRYIINNKRYMLFSQQLNSEVGYDWDTLRRPGIIINQVYGPLNTEVRSIFESFAFVDSAKAN